jgi:hypothetical protein
VAPHWQLVDKRGNGPPPAVPEWLDGWKPSLDDFPDMFIEPRHSVVVTIKGTQVLPCGAATNSDTRVNGVRVTLRFPRVQAFRLDDKCVADADPEYALEDLMKQGGAGLSSSVKAQWADGQAVKKRARAAAAARPGKRRGGGGGGGVGGVLEEFRPASVAGVGVEVNVFDGLQVYLVPDASLYRGVPGLPEGLADQAALQALIARAGGVPVSSFEPRATRYVVAASDTSRISSAKAHDFDVFTPAWLVAAHALGAIPPLQPEHLVHASARTRGELLRLVDVWGDAMAVRVSAEELGTLMRRMPADPLAAPAPAVAAPAAGGGAGAGAPAARVPPPSVAAALARFEPEERAALSHTWSLFRDSRPAGVPPAGGPGAVLSAGCTAFFDRFPVVPTSAGIQPAPLELCALTPLALRFRRFGGRVAAHVGRGSGVNIVVVDAADTARVGLLQAAAARLTAAAAEGGKAVEVEVEDGEGEEEEEDGARVKRARVMAEAAAAAAAEEDEAMVGAAAKRAPAVAIVTAAWVDDSIAAGRVLPVEGYLV